MMKRIGVKAENVMPAEASVNLGDQGRRPSDKQKDSRPSLLSLA